MRTAKGEDLIFISRILRDGSGVEIIDDQAAIGHYVNEPYRLNCLSVTYGTYIARLNLKASYHDTKILRCIHRRSGRIV